MWWAPNSPSKAWRERKEEERGIRPSFPASLIELGHLVSSSPALDWGLHQQFPGSQAFIRRGNHTIGFSGSPACRQQTTDHGTPQPPWSCGPSVYLLWALFHIYDIPITYIPISLSPIGCFSLENLDEHVTNSEILPLCMCPHFFFVPVEV